MQVLIMKALSFLLSKRYYHKIEAKNNLSINVFVYENKNIYAIHLSKQNFENQMELLMIDNKIIMFISKVLIDLLIVKQNIKIIFSG